MKRLSVLFSLVVLIFIWGCATTPSVQKDPAGADDHRRRARELISIMDHLGAAEEIGMALRLDPTPEDYLLRADLLEYKKRYPEAKETYQQGLKLTMDKAQLETFHYRLAILEATEFKDLKKARKLAGAIPVNSSRYFDLQAVFADLEGEDRQAIKYCDQAVAAATNNEEKAWALYHATLIYNQLNDEYNAFGALFNATNFGRGYGLVARIMEFWQANKNRKPGQ